MSYDRSDPDFPTITVDGTDPLDPAAYEFDELIVANNLTTDQNIAAKLDIEFPFSFSDAPATLKVGGKFTAKTKERVNNIQVYDGFDGDLTMDQVAGDFIPENFLDDRYQIGASPDPDKVNDLFEGDPSKFELDSDASNEETDPGNYNATENIISGYAMARLNFGALSTLFGARLETTAIEYTGNEVVFNEDGDYEGTNSLTRENDYSHIFPMVHFRYALADNSNVRAAFTTSLSRPNYYDLVPYRIVNREDEELEQGNPLLEPSTAVNIDLLGEHYFQSIGIVSGGLFYKQIDNYIYFGVSEISGGDFDGYESVQPVNADNTTLFGFELNWQQQLTFLPGALSGFGIYANYTFTDSKTKVPGREEEISLPGQAQHIGNIALSYEKYGFTGRISANFNGEFISEVGDSPEEDIYYDNHLQLDVSASYRLMENLSIFAELINLSDAPLRYYQGETTRPISQEYYSWWSHVGVKFDM